MQIISSAFKNGEYIPLKYSGYGDDVSPPLQIDDVSPNAKSLVLIVEDPDSPGKVWQHWLLWEVPSDATNIEEGTPPPGSVQGINDFGNARYGGPMPHMGTHHYYFRLYALDKHIALPEGARRHELDEAIEGSIIDSCELVGLYDAK